MRNATTFVSFSLLSRARHLELHPAISILQRHIQFLVERWEIYQEADNTPDEFEELFTPEWMQETLAQVVSRGTGHLSKVCLSIFLPSFRS